MSYCNHFKIDRIFHYLISSPSNLLFPRFLWCFHNDWKWLLKCVCEFPEEAALPIMWKASHHPYWLVWIQFCQGKNCCSTRYNIDKVNRQIIVWEKRFSLSNTNQATISSTRRELLQKSASGIIIVEKLGKCHEQVISRRGDLKCYDK